MDFKSLKILRLVLDSVKYDLSLLPESVETIELSNVETFLPLPKLPLFIKRLILSGDFYFDASNLNELKQLKYISMQDVPKEIESIQLEEPSTLEIAEIRTRRWNIEDMNRFLQYCVPKSVKKVVAVNSSELKKRFPNFNFEEKV